MTLILGLPFAFKQAGLMEGAFVLTLVAAGSVKAMLLLIECKYKCLSVLVPDLSNVRVSDGKGRLISEDIPISHHLTQK